MPCSLVAQQDLIIGPISDQTTVRLQGNLHPLARQTYDQGPVASSKNIPGMMLMLKRTDAQEKELQKLLQEQQDPASINYHKWLNPEQYAERFGASPADMSKIISWLELHHFTVKYSARSHTFVFFAGTAESVRNAFQAEIHYYKLSTETHYAAAAEPAIPAALEAVVFGLSGMDDFYPKPNIYLPTVIPGFWGLVPGDLHAIYNIPWDLTDPPGACPSFDGCGQKVVIVGQAPITATDIDGDITTYYQTYSYLVPTAAPSVTVIEGPSPGPGLPSDWLEAYLDIDMVLGVAPLAQVSYVYSADAFQAAIYAIDQNIAPVLSMSFGKCEPMIEIATAEGYRNHAQQANAMGITWVASSGDSGAADCVSPGAANGGGVTVGQTLLSVNLPASIPEVTAVGGTRLTLGTGCAYMNFSNQANGTSANCYIPEVAWNDTSATNGVLASGGGYSALFAVPAWQKGLPAISFNNGLASAYGRGVPDVAFSAGTKGPDDYPYVILQNGNLTLVGGTSAANAVFAGIVVLLNQSNQNSYGQQPGLGNINPTLYSLAQVTPQIFHDVTSGNNFVSFDCSSQLAYLCNTQTPSGWVDLVGFQAGPGYDLVTGWGSVDASALLQNWPMETTSSVNITGVGNGASFAQSFAPGMLMTVFGTGLSSGSPQTVTAVPLPLMSSSGTSVTINGIAAPLLYISATQINLQVPYELSVGTAVLTVSTGGQSTSINFTIQAAAPGIFVDSQNGYMVPNESAAAGSTIGFYLTGAGQVSPAEADGNVPYDGQTPTPNLPLSMTVGGVPVVPVYVGIPEWSIGVLQINFTVPLSVASGSQPVVVTIGGVPSPAALLTVTP